MLWEKKGLIYRPDGRLPWAKQRAFPTNPLLMDDDVFRIYVGFCDENMVGRVGFVEVDANNPSKVLRISEKPVLDIGVPGAFDENGILPLSVLRVDDEIYMYYTGYQLGYKVRYYQFTGLAISRDNGDSFIRYKRVPVLDRSDKELTNRTSVHVLLNDGIFKMWYVGGSEWTNVDGKLLPIYNIRYLESNDGKTWGEEGKVCIDFANEDEHAFGRPFVYRDGGIYKMFYSIRTRSKKGYGLGYAESRNGIDWTRKDAEVGIGVSDSGWDSQMIEYASIFRYKGKTYMFYNGNNMGETGFGYAVLKS